LEILEYCDSKDLIKREQYYIDLLKPEYNILKIAGSRFGSIHTKETRAKMSSTKAGRKLSEETRAKISSAIVGKKHSDETRAKISSSKIGKKLSEDIRAKMSSSKVGEQNPRFGKLRLIKKYIFL
jgi:group I intron endonuclease